MTIDERVGDFLKLDRTPIEVRPQDEYKRIGIYSWGKGFLHRPAVPGAEMGSMRYFTFPSNALVLSNIQAWEAAIAVSGQDELGFVASNRFLPYVPRASGTVDTTYLLHYFLSDEGLQALRRASPGTQVRNRTLGKQLFEDLRVPLPHINEQRRIAAHLDAVAARIDAGARGLTNPAALTPALLNELVATQPEDLVGLGDLAEITRGVTPALEAGGYGIIGQAAVRWTGVDHTQLKGANKDWAASVPSARRTRLGDVLLNSTGEGTIGRACVVTEDASGLLTDSKVLTVRCGPGLMSDFLAAFLRSTRGQAAIDDIKGANTTKQTELGVGRAQALRVPCPDLDKQADVIKRWKAAGALVDRLATLDGTRRDLLNSVLPAARNEVFSALR